MALGAYQLFIPGDPSSSSSLACSPALSSPIADHALAMSQSDPSVARIDSSRTAAPAASHQSTGLTPSSSSPGATSSSSSPGPYIEYPTPYDPGNAQPSTSPAPGSTGSAQSDSDTSATNPSPALLDVDPQILEALRGKDRIYVLKLGETFETLIKERRPRCDLTPATSYQRLLVHRCSAYYKLIPESDPTTKGISVSISPESRIPERRICELVPAESPTQPAFKIMRRSVPERRSKPQSLAGSVAGEDADLSDVEPSEAGSLGGRSNITSNSSTKKRMTIEEREAAYNEARSRIFMDFEEKERGKEKDMSASSSSLSVSGSTSTSAGGTSSLGDTDDAISSPATESEWSTPSGSYTRKDGRRGGHHNGSNSSSRSLRSGGSFHANGSGGSSRNSRAPSPSFVWPSLYEPSPSGGQIYDPSQHHPPNMGYHPNQFAYSYPPSNNAPNPPFLAPYPAYYPQPYNPYQQQPPMPQQQDATTPPGPEQPYAPQHQMNYGPTYGWPPHPNQPPLQSPPHTMHAPLPQQPQQNPPPPPPPHSVGPHPPHPPPPPHSPPYPPYNMHPQHAYTYPMGAYYPPPPPPGQPQQMQPPPPPPPGPPAHPQGAMQQQQQAYPGYEVPRSMNMNANPMQLPPGHGPVSPEGHFNGGHNGNNLNNHHLNNQHQNHQSHAGNPPRHNLGNGVIPPIGNGGGRGPQRNGSGFGSGAPNHHGGHNNANGPGAGGNGKHRGPVPPAARSAWSYGPGVGMGGIPANFGNNAGGNVNGNMMNGNGGGEAVGPRLYHSNSNSNRRTSGHGSSGGNSRGSSSNTDEVSSVASSSTTSSSSRRTYTSTTSSSQHPLPARPDWAVGMKAQPTLAATGGRHHDLYHSNSNPTSTGNSRTMSPISPPRSNSGSNALQAMDFPPLNPAGPLQERVRAPVVSGAWGSARPILAPAANNANANTSANLSASGSAPVSAQNSPNPNVQPNANPIARQEDGERPVGKAGELYNPKLIKRPGPPLVNGTSPARAGPSSPAQANMNARNDSPSAQGNALAAQMALMSVEEDLGGDVTILQRLSVPSAGGAAPSPAST